jgi:hypothetical protein
VEVKRKFNLGRVGHPYESLGITVEAYCMERAARVIEKAWQKYKAEMKAGKIE